MILGSTLDRETLLEEYPLTWDWHSAVRVTFLPKTNPRTIGNVLVRLEEPLLIRTTWAGTETLILLPRHFHSDGASVFRWARWLIGSPTDWKNLVPGLAHDWLVTLRPDGTLPVSRERAANLFRHLLALRRKRRFTRFLMWLLVKLDAIARRFVSRFTGRM